MMLRMGLFLVATALLVTHMGCACSGRYCDTTCPMSGRFYDGQSCDAPGGSCGCNSCGGGNGWFTNYHTTCQGCGDMYWGEAFGSRCDSCDNCGNFNGGGCCPSPWEYLADCWTMFWGCDYCGSGGCCGGCSSCGGYDSPYSNAGCSSCGGGNYGPMHGATIQEGVIEQQGPTQAHPGGSAMRQSVLRPSSARSNVRYTTQQMSYQEPTPTVRKSSGSTNVRVATAASMPAPPLKGQPAMNVVPSNSGRTVANLSSTPTGAMKSTGSRVPQTAEDFDLPAGARIIRIEEAE